MTQAPAFRLKDRRVWVAGDRGMMGQALTRRLASEQCTLVTVDRERLDLRRQADVERWMAETGPEVVIMAAATVGGILANDTRPAEFIYDNLAIETNVIEAARRNGVAKLLFLGSACVYPRDAAQPMKEGALLTGPLEPTNQWYSVAKINGLMLCRAYRRQYGCDFISAMPTNLFGQYDNFDLVSGHVVPALLAKAHHARVTEAATLEVWGTGKPTREFMFVDDAADALVFLLKHYSQEQHVNIGVGYDVSIKQIAEMIAEVVNFEGRLEFDQTKPDGMPRRLLDSSLILGMGWKPRTELKAGLEKTYSWFLSNEGATARSG